MGIHRAVGPPRPRAGFLIAQDNRDEMRLPSFVVDRTFERGIWKHINDECGTDIDEYEGVTLEPAELRKAAELIRRDVNEDKGAPDDYAEVMFLAVEMLGRSASRHVAVMFSL